MKISLRPEHQQRWHNIKFILNLQGIYSFNIYKPKTLSETVLSEVPLNMSKNQKPQQKQLKIVENALGCAVDFQLQWGTQQSRFKLISTTRARARARTLSERKAHMPQGHRHLRGCLLHTYICVGASRVKKVLPLPQRVSLMLLGSICFGMVMGACSDKWKWRNGGIGGWGKQQVE